MVKLVQRRLVAPRDTVNRVSLVQHSTRTQVATRIIGP
jgi:hypothetical protein